MSKKNVVSLDGNKEAFCENLEHIQALVRNHTITDGVFIGVGKEGGTILSAYINEDPVVLLSNIELFKADLVDFMRMSSEERTMYPDDFEGEDDDE